MNLRELEYIVTLAEEKSLTKAADRLFITPSALTQQVLRLEKELHTPLFLRSRNGWQTTQAGEIYLQAAKKMLFMKQDTYKQIQDLTARKAYSVTIGFPPERGSAMFSAIYPVFREKYPDITIHLRETSVLSQQDLVASGQLDLGFMTLADSQKTQDEYITLQKEEILIAVPDTYPDELLMAAPPQKDSPYPVISLKKLKNEPFAMMSGTSTLRGVQEEIFRRNQIQPIVSFETARAKTIFEMISYNLCCALVCEYHVLSQKSRKAKIFAMPDHPYWEIAACYRKGKYLSEVEKYLIQLVKQYCIGALNQEITPSPNEL